MASGVLSALLDKLLEELARLVGVGRVEKALPDELIRLRDAAGTAWFVAAVDVRALGAENAEPVKSGDILEE